MIEITYAIYLVISIAMTGWVTGTLHVNGHVFLVDSFGGNAAFAVSVTHLLGRRALEQQRSAVPTVSV